MTTNTAVVPGENQVNGKCSRPSVRNAENLAKFPLNRLRADRYSAKIATRKRKDFNKSKLRLVNFCKTFQKIHF
jgi:hypothetical protein